MQKSASRKYTVRQLRFLRRAASRKLAGAARGEVDQESIPENQDAILHEVQERDRYITEVVALCDHRLEVIQGHEQELARLQALLEEQGAAVQGVEGEKAAALERLEAVIIDQQATLNEIRSKALWRMTRPVRVLGGVIRRKIWKNFALKAVPVHDVQRGDSKGLSHWQSVGPDPQFLLRPKRGSIPYGAWFRLSLLLKGEDLGQATLYVDCGEGFGEANTLVLDVADGGRVDSEIYLPQTCRGLRLDPLDREGEFLLDRVFLRQIRGRVPECHAANAALCSFWERQDGQDFVLHPLSQLRKHLKAGFDWISRGEDPYFLFDYSGTASLAGWVMLEVNVRLDGEREHAKFYFDFGEGFSEKHAVSVPLQSGKVCKRLYYLPKPPQSIRFDPCESEIAFSIESIRFKKVAEWFALNRMLRRVGSKVGEFKKMSPRQIRSSLEEKVGRDGFLDALREHYDSTFIVPRSSMNYEAWIRKYEAPEFSDGEEFKRRVEALARRPLISVVMPVYNTDEHYLRRCIESVLNQSYPDLELCIADDASPRERVRTVLKEYAARDSRVKLVFRKENGHISRASNSALELVQGEYTALLDHDDELAEHALYYVAQAVNDHPEAAIIYTDEDKIDEEGKRDEPHFKSDWNPDLLLAQNYISHLGVYSTDLIRSVGGFRTGVEGSQDYDLLLRCVARIKDEQIIHIPWVLYHWRAISGSTALASSQKSYTTDAGIAALENYFDMIGKPVQVERGMVPNTFRVRYPVPDPEPLVSLLIPTRDGYEILSQCVTSILEKTTYTNYEIIILDNQTSDPVTLEYFQELENNPKIRVLSYDKPFNYSAINNFGVRHAKGDVIGLINNDIEVISEGWLTEMVSHALREEVGCVGAKLYYSNGQIQHAGVILGLGGVAGHSHKYFPRESHGYFRRLILPQNLAAVTAACLLVRKEVYESVNGLNEEDLTIAFNDVDFCIRVYDAGYQNVWTPYAELYHHESISRGEENTPEKVERFNGEIQYMKKTWTEILAKDPYYSVNLTKDFENFSIR